MPSSSYESPSFGSKGPHWEKRVKSWTNTSNYGSVSRSDLPINQYRDIRVQVYQGPTTATYGPESGGGVLYALQNEYVYSANDFQAWKDFAYRESDFVGFANECVDTVKRELYKKLADSKSNLAVFAVEAKKTSDMIYEVASKIYRAGRLARRGRLYDAAITLGVSPGKAHNTHLMHRYGIIPLMMDVKGQAEFVAQQLGLGGRKPEFRVRVKKSFPFSWGRSLPFPRWGDGLTAYYFERLYGSFECTASMDCELTSRNLNALQQIGLTNPLTLAWEVIPFSFVFDWFCQVGDYLEGLSAFHGVTVKKSFLSNCNVLTYEYRMDPTLSHNGGWYYANGLYSGRHVSRDYFRNPDHVFDPLLTAPGINVKGNFRNLVTGLALLKGNSRSFGKLTTPQVWGRKL